MNKFTPDPTYEGLRIQANALFQIAKASEKIQATYMKKDYSLSEPRLKALEESLRSERDMNAILTRELEEANERIRYFETELETEDI
jgi:hypothetical protein